MREKYTWIIQRPDGTTAKVTEDAVRRKCMEVFGAAFEMWSGVVDFKNGYIAKLDKQKKTT